MKFCELDYGDFFMIGAVALPTIESREVVFIKAGDGTSVAVLPVNRMGWVQWIASEELCTLVPRGVVGKHIMGNL